MIITFLLALSSAGCTSRHKEVILLNSEFEEIVMTTVAELRQIAEKQGKDTPEFLSDFYLESLQMLQFYKAEALDEGVFLESPESQDLDNLYIPVDSSFGRLIKEFLPEEDRRYCIHENLIRLDKLESILLKEF